MHTLVFFCSFQKFSYESHHLRSCETFDSACQGFSVTSLEVIYFGRTEEVPENCVTEL